jgi:hypothetical protein
VDGARAQTRVDDGDDERGRHVGTVHLWSGALVVSEREQRRRIGMSLSTRVAAATAIYSAALAGLGATFAAAHETYDNGVAAERARHRSAVRVLARTWANAVRRFPLLSQRAEHDGANRTHAAAVVVEREDHYDTLNGLQAAYDSAQVTYEGSVQGARATWRAALRAALRG